MNKKKFAGMASVFYALLLCALGSSPTNAQVAGTGVDPNAVLLDDFETGTTSRWTARPGTRGEKMSFELMEKAKGDLIRFGNYALKVNINFTDAQANQTLTAQISPGTSGSALQIPGNAAGGKKLGMWVYATPGVQGMWLRVSTRTIGATTGVTNSDLASAINWTGWKYVQCNLPANHEFHPDGIRLLTLKSYSNYYANGYIIIDNIRVTNQSFTEDVTPPTINSVTGNGQNLSGTYTTSIIDLAASFNDLGNPASGIDHSRTYIAIDGYVFKAGDAGFTTNEASNSVSLNGANLSNGNHNVMVHIEDKYGHVTERTSSFTIDASDGKTTQVSALPPSQAFVGTPFEIKINSNNSKDIKELELILELNNIGSVDATNGINFSNSTSAGSNYTFDPRNGLLKINLKNDITADATETLATIKVNISKNSNPTDILRCTPVSAKAIYADNSLSLFSLFTAFSRDILASYDFTVKKRIVGAPGEVLVTDLNGIPQSGVTVYALNSSMTEEVGSAITGNDGIASGMNFTGTAQNVNIYAGKEGKYSYTKLVRTLNPLLTSTPSYIRAGATANPQTTKTITWVVNPIEAANEAILKIAKKTEGESAFRQISGTSKILEYNAVASNGISKANSVTAVNLEPGTSYIYQVGDGTTWSPTMEFTTTSETKRFSFSAFGDLQASSTGEMSRFLAAAQTIEEMPERPYFNINVGDIVDTDDRSDYYSFYGHLFNQRPGFSSIDMVSAYGNHEYMGNVDADNIKFVNGHHSVEPSDKYNNKIVGSGSYASEYGNMLVIALDWAHKGGASVNAILEEQVKWMDDILSKSNKTWKVVTMHYPIYPYESTPGAQAIIAPVLDKHKVQLVLCGHGHTFERVQVANGNYLMPISNKRTFTPAIGGSLHFQLGDMTGTGQNGRWIHCAVDGKKMDVTVRDANNSIVTSECFTLYAAPLNNYTVAFNALDENGTISATVDNVAITSGGEVSECKNILFKATPNSGHQVKEWKINNTVVTGNKENNLTITSLSETTTVSVEFESNTAVNDLLFPDLSIYPNPFEEATHITGAEGCTLRIVDIAGTSVHAQTIKDSDEMIQLKELQPGIYFFHFEKEKQSKVLKVIKK